MKVCHMTSVHESTDARVFYKESVSLAKAGYETFLVAQGESREDEGVHVIGLGKAPASRLKRMTGFSKEVYNKAAELDAEVYHLHDPELLPYVSKLKKLGKKVIFDSHENTLEQMEEKEWIPKCLRKIISFFYSHYAIKQFRKCDAIITVTPSILRQLSQYNEKVCMVTNYPHYSAESSVKGEHSSKALCFTGQIENIWCHAEIIKSLEKIEGCVYNLCGSADEEYLQKLKELPGWEKVNYLGLVPHDKATEVQLDASIGIAALRPGLNTAGMEGTLGNTKIFEYMKAELPVICTNFTLWKEIVEKYRCGICVDPTNIKEIASAVNYLLSNPKEAKQMGLNGCKAVEQEFNWRTQETELLALYETLT